MNRTLVGRITFLRGIRHQAETFIRQATELGNWTPFAAVALLWIFSRTYQQEKQRMHEERVRPLREERERFLRVERELAKEIDAKSAGRGRSLLPRRVRRAS
jgi:hypothetical protein